MYGGYITVCSNIIEIAILMPGVRETPPLSKICRIYFSMVKLRGKKKIYMKIGICNLWKAINPQRTELFGERCLLRGGVSWTPNIFWAKFSKYIISGAALVNISQCAVVLPIKTPIWTSISFISFLCLDNQI